MLNITKTLKATCVAILFTLGGLFTNAVLAETVTHKIVPLNLTAEADFVKGDADKPAVIIIHGFLTTNQFHTVRSMSQAFEDAGYSVLTPTLTLGINLRKQSVKCNSIHTHTLENDIIEVVEWIKWLETEQGKKEVVVVGHSSGSQELLAMLNKNQQPNVKLAIFTSLFYLSGPELGTDPQELDYAKQALAAKQNRPHKYSFLFCKKNFYATPQSFLSYQKLTRQHVIDELKSLTIPSYTLMGGADKRYQSVGENWLEELKQAGTNLVVVDGANHFFSSEHEFDLQEHLVNIIQAHFP